MEFFNNKENESLKFKINSEGININNIEPRLILVTKENKNYLFIGEITNDVCKFNIPKLESLNTDDEGKIKFEIISEDMYFPVWEDKFHIKTKANIKIEEMISQMKQDDEPKKVSVRAILETEKKEEPKRKELEHIKESKKEPMPKVKEENIRHFNEFFKK